MEALDRELETWLSFETALRQDNRVLFAKMLSEVKEYWPAFEAASNKEPTEALLMAIIFQQQKMISKLIRKIEKQPPLR